MLKSPPTLAHLSRLYFELSRVGADAVGKRLPWPYHPTDLPALAALAADMSRYDPRLLGILVGFFLKRWRKVNPTLLRQHFDEMQTSQTLGVIGEFLLAATSDPELEQYVHYVQSGLRPVPLQYYFFGLYQPGGLLAERAIGQSLAEYKRWGFLGTEHPVVDPYRKKTVGSLDGATRASLLRRLAERQRTFRLGDYLTAIGACVSRQQALNDLKAATFLHCEGRGRGARWSLTESSAQNASSGTSRNRDPARARRTSPAL